MSPSPSASIVIPVLNAAATLGDTLHALRNQLDAPHDLQIIVVDNGSTDDSPHIAARYNVTILHERVRGASAARNCGLDYASGDIYVGIDADTIPSRTWLREILLPFQDPAIMLVGGQTLSFRPETPIEHYIDQAGLFLPEHNIQHLGMPFVPGMNMAVRREAALAVGGWAQDLLLGEDIDFSIRLTNHLAAEPHYQPTAVLFHRSRNTEAGLFKQARGYGYGAGRVYRRHPQALGRSSASTIHLIGLFLQRGTTYFSTRLRQVFSHSGEKELSFARYHYLWIWHFLRGYLAGYHNR